MSQSEATLGSKWPFAANGPYVRVSCAALGHKTDVRPIGLKPLIAGQAGLMEPEVQPATIGALAWYSKAVIALRFRVGLETS